MKRRFYQISLATTIVALAILVCLHIRKNYYANELLSYINNSEEVYVTWTSRGDPSNFRYYGYCLTHETGKHQLVDRLKKKLNYQFDPGISQSIPNMVICCKDENGTVGKLYIIRGVMVNGENSLDEFKEASYIARKFHSTEIEALLDSSEGVRRHEFLWMGLDPYLKVNLR